MTSMREFAEPLEIASPCGHTFDAFEQAESYWHASVALHSVDGTAVVFTTVEHLAGHWFDVFPIQFSAEPAPRGEPRRLPNAMAVLLA